jgi:hypothetical protein
VYGKAFDCAAKANALCLRHPPRYYAGMRFTYVAAAVGMAIAVPFMAPAPLAGVPSAHADFSGYSRCVGNVQQVPLSEPDAQSMQLARQVEMDLKTGVSPGAEARKLGQMGFDPHFADVIVQCVQQEQP